VLKDVAQFLFFIFCLCVIYKVFATISIIKYKFLNLTKI
jgi:hypothetical protein